MSPSIEWTIRNPETWYHVSGGHLNGTSDYALSVVDERGFVVAICNDYERAKLIAIAPLLRDVVVKVVNGFDDGDDPKDLIYLLQDLASQCHLTT